MRDEIATYLTTAIGQIVPLYYCEASTDTYPYAVYDLVSRPKYTKEGVYSIRGEVTIRIYNSELDPATDIARSIDAAILAKMPEEKFAKSLISYEDECIDNVWCIQLIYNINQKK